MIVWPNTCIEVGIYQSPDCPLCNSNQEMDSEHLKICASVAGHDNIFEKYWCRKPKYVDVLGGNKTTNLNVTATDLFPTVMPSQPQNYFIPAPGIRIPSRPTIHDLVDKVKSTGSFLNKKCVQQRRVLTEEKLDESVHNGDLDPLLTFFTDEAWFHLHSHVSTQNNRYWATENPHIIHEVPHHAAKVGVRCAVSLPRESITRPQEAGAQETSRALRGGGKGKHASRPTLWRREEGASQFSFCQQASQSCVAVKPASRPEFDLSMCPQLCEHSDECSVSGVCGSTCSGPQLGDLIERNDNAPTDFLTASVTATSNAQDLSTEQPHVSSKSSAD
ncbi:hypothetical protein ANN_17624 [Periplaneta americana]|uniref:Uncharacterized protein n=1 Tax=Periplaneta americana TaxID=6978 RepID=A0ABQ8SUR6_PERAM|nr:hypothetical protein ANN_17624 [Periplaneta americana]